MTTIASMAEIGALIGDPARAAMLQSLMDGRALTASELAHVAGIARPTASEHLRRLAEANVLASSRQGRHRYFRVASPQVARMLESVMLVASEAVGRRPRSGPRDERMRLARTCYDHIAGWLGVSLADAMAARGWVAIEDDAALVTERGLDRLGAVGIALADTASPRAGARPLCRPCLDWSERRPHLAGRLGAALCRHGLDRHWIRRRQGSRTLEITPAGWVGYRDLFGIERPA